MGWRFRRTFGVGPFKTTVSSKGVGESVSFLGFKFGVATNGKRFISFGIKGTGLYFIKYIS